MSAPRELNEAEILEARDIWLSRRMFGWIVDGTHGTRRYTETRTFEQFCVCYAAAVPPTNKETPE